MNVNINTRLTAPCIPNAHMNMIQIGTTPCFTFDLYKQIIKLKDITQLKFIFKQGAGEIIDFDLYNNPTTKQMNSHFEYDEILDVIRFTMTSEETLQFEPTNKCGLLVDFEIVVIIGDRQLVFADEDSKIYVLDSLYREAIEI